MDLQRAAWKVFSVQKKELGFAVPLFVLYLLSGSFYAFGQIYTETFFLKAYGAQGLSKFFVYNGLALILCGIIYNYFIFKITLRKGYYLLVTLFSSLILSSILVIDRNYTWIPLYLFLGNYLFTFFLDIHFFNFAFQYLSIRSSKRILPLLMGGGKLGGILASLLVFSVFSRNIIQYGGVLWCLNGFLIVLPLIYLGFYARPMETRRQHAGEAIVPDSSFFDKIAERVRLSMNTPIFKYSVLAVLVMAVVNLVAEYYFALIFNRAYPSKNELARFLSLYTFVADFVTLIFQIFLASRIIRRLGVQKSNIVYPASFIVFLSGMVLAPGVIAGVLLRFFRKNMSVIFRHPVFNIIMAASPRDKTAEMKSFISAIVQPLGMVAGGGVILLISRKLPVYGGYGLAALLGIFYIGLTVLQNRSYLRSLKDQLRFDVRADSAEALSAIDNSDLYRDPVQVEENLELFEALFRQKPDIALARILIRYFRRLGPETREEILTLARSQRLALPDDVIAAALADGEPVIRGLAIERVQSYPSETQRRLLQDNFRPSLVSEEYAFDCLMTRLARSTRRGNGTDIEASKFVINLLTMDTGESGDRVLHERLYEIRNEVFYDALDPVEFFILSRVVSPDLYIPLLVELAVRTRSLVLLKAILPHAEKLRKRQARRVFYAFRTAPFDYLNSFVRLSGSLTEMEKALALNCRRAISDSDMARFFSTDEKVRRIVIERLFRRYSFYHKANCLNYLISLGIKPKKEMTDFIGYEIDRIIELMSVRAAFACRLDLEGKEKLACSVLGKILADEIELHKQLILKAIGIMTGVELDEIYESNIFLKDKDITGYIVEYIDSSGEFPRKTVFLFEPEMQDVHREMLFEKKDFKAIARSFLATGSFLPELSGLIAFSLQFIDDSAIPVSRGRRETRGNYLPEENDMLNLLGKIIFLKENQLFNDINIAELIHVAKVTREVELPAGKMLIREGETGDELYIIIEGEVEVYSGQKMIDRFSSGSCIGELSIIDKEPRSASVRVRKKTRLLALNRNDFLLTLKDNPTIAINIMQVLTQRLRKMLD